MTSDRILKYIGQKWKPDRDCLYWFTVIQKNEFGRDVFPAKVNHEGHTAFVKSAADLMGPKLKEVFGWVETKDPKEGDAVFMSQRKRPHHVGTLVDIGGEYQVLHAIEGVGMVLSDMLTLRLNGWKITGYYTDGNK